MYHFAVKVQLAAAATAVALSLCAAGCAGPQLSEAELSDHGIKARVEERLRAEPNLDLRFLNVDAHLRVVTISGLVTSYDERRRIERAASRVPGVEQVLINLAVDD